jgi:hypothetical protein
LPLRLQEILNPFCRSSEMIALTAQTRAFCMISRVVNSVFFLKTLSVLSSLGLLLIFAYRMIKTVNLRQNLALLDALAGPGHLLSSAR